MVMNIQYCANVSKIVLGVYSSYDDHVFRIRRREKNKNNIFKEMTTQQHTCLGRPLSRVYICIYTLISSHTRRHAYIFANIWSFPFCRFLFCQWIKFLFSLVEYGGYVASSRRECVCRTFRIDVMVTKCVKGFIYIYRGWNMQKL